MRNYRIEYKNLAAGSDDLEIYQCQASSVIDAVETFKRDVGDDESLIIVSVRGFHS